MGAIAAADRTGLDAPRVAWPTLGLFAAALAAWAGSAALHAAGWLGSAAALGLSSAAAFVLFTPLHDAAHRSLGRSSALSGLVGRIAALVLAGPFPAFRFVHHEHHRHTNEPGRDPDLWSGGGPAALRPLRWLTQDLHYYAFVGRRWRQRPVGESLETVLTLVALVAACVAATRSGLGASALWCWILPARLALAALAFAFDYLPHRPHAVPARVDPYRATGVSSDAWLTPLFLYQNYHLVHHLYPGVPFYRYARVWRAQRDELLARGASDRRLFGL
jgi:fatty acid desaturase